MANRTKEGFENWKLLHIFLHGNDIKGWINETNYNDPFLEEWWIMEVVEKVWDIQDGEDGDTIRSHRYKVKISHLSCFVTDVLGDDNEPFIECLDGITTKDSVYLAMVEFVKYWNTQNYNNYKKHLIR